SNKPYQAGSSIAIQLCNDRRELSYLHARCSACVYRAIGRTRDSEETADHERRGVGAEVIDIAPRLRELVSRVPAPGTAAHEEEGAAILVGAVRRAANGRPTRRQPREPGGLHRHRAQLD